MLVSRLPESRISGEAICRENKALLNGVDIKVRALVVLNSLVLVRNMVCVLFVLVASLIVSPESLAQQAGVLRIVLDAPEVQTSPEFQALGLSQFDGSAFPPNTVRFRVLLGRGDLPPEDITQTTTWQLRSNLDDAAILGPGVVVLVTPCASVSVRVLIPNMHDETFTIRCLGEYTPQGYPPENSPPLDNGSVEVGSQGAVNHLGQRGIPILELQRAQNTSDQRDESEVNVPLRGSINPLTGNRWLKDGDDALTTFATGKQKQNNGDSRWVNFSSSNPMIVLSPPLAKDLVDGTFRNANGTLSKAVKTLFHELLHVVVHKHDIKFNPVPDKDLDGDGDIDVKGKSEVDVEEDVVHRMEQVLDTIDKIKKNIDTIPRTPELDAELKALFKTLRNLLKGIKDDSPNDPDGTDPVDKLLHELEWDDLNNNNVPDFIERWLEEKGIPLTPLIQGESQSGGAGGE